MAVIDVTEKTFVDEVLMAAGLVVVDYWADWCAPCKQMSPILDELAAEFGEVKFVKVDTNTNPNLAAEQGVLSLPTLQFFQSGRVEKSLTGGKTKNALKKAINELI
jgi:thioredoxin 1